MYSAQFKIYWAQNTFLFSHVWNIHFVAPCTLHFGAAAQPAPLPRPSAPVPTETFLSENEGRVAIFGILATLVWPCTWYHSDKCKDFSSQMRLRHSVILSFIFPWQHQNFCLISRFQFELKWKMEGRRFDAVVDIWKNMTAELTIIAAYELARCFRSCTNFVTSVCGFTGIVVREVTNKHISVCIDFIIFQFHDALSTGFAS